MGPLERALKIEEIREQFKEASIALTYAIEGRCVTQSNSRKNAEQYLPWVIGYLLGGLEGIFVQNKDSSTSSELEEFATVLETAIRGEKMPLIRVRLTQRFLDRVAGLLPYPSEDFPEIYEFYLDKAVPPHETQDGFIQFWKGLGTEGRATVLRGLSLGQSKIVAEIMDIDVDKLLNGPPEELNLALVASVMSFEDLNAELARLCTEQIVTP